MGSLKKTFLIVFIAGIFLIYFLNFKVNANEEIFYPQNCLGSFSNPQKAALKPEANSLDEINELNSAVYYSGFKEIYCGDFSSFQNETSTSRQIKKITLNFNYVLSKELIQKPIVAVEDENGVLNVLEQIIPPQTIEIINNQTTSTETESTTLKNTTQTSSTDESVNSSTQSETPPSQSETPSTQNEASSTQNEDSSTPSETQSIQNNNVSSPQNFSTEQLENQSNNQEITIEQNPKEEIQTNDSSFFNFIDFAFAQNLENDVLNSNDSTTAQSTTENLISPSSLETNSSSINTTTLDLQTNTSSEQNILSNETSSTSTLTFKPLFDVYYTLDGSNWNYLGSINIENWKNLTFDIPVNENIDISKIQIKINSYPDTDYYLYLESMSLNVEYLNNDSNSLKNENMQANIGLLNNLNTSTDTTNIATTTSSTLDIIANTASTAESNLIDEQSNLDEENDSDEDLVNQQSENSQILPSILENLKTRKIQRILKIQNSDNISCLFNSFIVNLKEEKTELADLNLAPSSFLKKLEIGSLPDGIDVVFENGNYEILTKNSKLNLKIYRQRGSQKGNFNIPIIYSENNSTIVCQLNIEAF